MDTGRIFFKKTAGKDDAMTDRKPDAASETAPVCSEETKQFMRMIGIPEELHGADVLIRQMTEAVKNRREGCWKDLPEDVWIATMKAFPRFIGEHRASYGYDGFDRGFWTVRQVNARLFRIGELEYELIDEKDEPKVIGLHIASDSKLEPDLLNRSVKAARAFLKQYFPAYAKKPIVCESWLLSPKLKEVLKEGSRILNFQKAFDITSVDDEAADALEWVFKVAYGQRETYEKEKLPEDTSLQKALKKMILSGEMPGAAEGILARKF